MIIDSHGHYTTEPEALFEFRRKLLEAQDDPARTPDPDSLEISDEQIRSSVADDQLRLQRERGTDVTIFSPRAAGMGHHQGSARTSETWSRVCNDLIRRVTDLFPGRFIGVGQLPQSPGVRPDNTVAELRRCVEELGFVGCNLNPDPSGGYWTDPPLTDEWWFPVYEAMVELDVPAMIHVSASCNPNFHGTGAHYLAADTAVFMQLLTSDLFERFPTLRFVIPHGGGAVPYHWGRYRGLAQNLGRGDLEDLLMNNVSFDTCVYHQRGIDLLCDVIDAKNILFASEMVGAVRGVDPQTGHDYDDTRRYIDAAQLTDDQRQLIFEGNARRVYPRLGAALEAAERDTAEAVS